MMLALLVACAGTLDSGDTDGSSNERAPYPYLLLADMTWNASGVTPGSDIDAIELDKGRGGTHWASTVVDARLLGESNEHTDPSALLGPSDSDCETYVFASLGGQGGYVIVSFGEDVTIENGDTVTVYEIGTKMCPDTSGVNEPWEIGGLREADPQAMRWIGRGWGLEDIVVDSL